MATLRQFLDGKLVRHVLKLDPPLGRGNDRMVWALTNSGIFSTASTYSLVCQSSNSSWFSSRIWQKGLPVKISFFIFHYCREGFLLWTDCGDLVCVAPLDVGVVRIPRRRT